MSPIIELQRRMVEAGRIRAGEKGDKGEPRKLTHWRLTSKDRVRLQHAAKLWGGEVREWSERAGEFELYTETAELPIMLLPGHVPSTWYELWSKGGCQRRCDGVHEIISDSACLCGDERECKPYTRLSVLLPDLPGIGSWLLSSTGWNAAAELAGAADLLQRASAQGVLIPARLRLEQRTSVQGGQTRKFSVPVLDVDVAFRELLGAGGALRGGERALPQGYTPIEARAGNGTSLAEGLEIAETQVLTRKPRVELPEDDVLDEGDEAGASLPPPDSSPSGSPAAPQDKPLSLRECKTKLNALVGQLRESKHITTEQVYARMASMRNVDVETMIGLTEGARDEEGVLHWAPLRDSLVVAEARELHARLAKLWVNVQPKDAA